MYKKIGRRIYYDNTNGNVIEDTGELSGYVAESTIEDDIKKYKSLSILKRESFSVIQLEYNQYAQDFKECSGYRINVETNKLEFSYPDESESNESLIYRKPLSEKVEGLEIRTQATEDMIMALMFEGVK